MAKKHFDEYYNKIYSQLLSLEESLNVLNEDIEKGMASPEREEEFKQTIKPIRDSYLTLSYVKYLLDMPNRNSKASKYKQRNEKFLKKIQGKTGPEIIEQNQKILNDLKNSK